MTGIRKRLQAEPADGLALMMTMLGLRAISMSSRRSKIYYNRSIITAQIRLNLLNFSIDKIHKMFVNPLIVIRVVFTKMLIQSNQ